MANAAKINALLHSAPVAQSYRAKAGDYLDIELPQIPLTRYTEFVQLKAERRGDIGSFAEVESPEEGEGTLLPRRITVRAVRPGRMQIVLRAVDALSGEDLPDVEPLDIEVEAHEG
jgi:hypothetical protein